MQYKSFPIAALLVFLTATAFATETSNNCRFQAVPFTSVHFDDAFWSPRLKTNREISIPHNFKWCEETGRFTNFAKAAKLMDGEFQGIYYNDSDVYKLLEGTAYCLADHPDKELEKQADAVIAWIAAAQQPNGYINSYYTLREPDKKWTNTRVMHELYCIGHMIEAAIAYQRATGKTTLLEVAEKAVAHVADVFGYEEGKRREVPGHQEIELALVKLYELTGQEKYFDLAKMFIDIRGDQTKRTDRLQGMYTQDHLPVRQMDDAVGHAVRAMYLYCGMTDIAAKTGDSGLMEALDKLWNRVVDKKMYITGGIGSRHEGETFGDDYELPNRTAYCETCAAIGLTFWAHRMNLMHGNAQYADIVERAIYNGVLSGIGMDGKSFFYVNPLESVGNHHRQPFFSTACCPTNVVRFVSSLPGYQYAIDKDESLVINLFVQGKATIDHPTKGKFNVEMTTDYPISGKVQIKFSDLKQNLRFKLRIPEHMRADRVTYLSPGMHETMASDGKGYLWFTATPEQNDFTVGLRIETKRMISHPNVTANRGRVAIQRGPLVYCFEQCDNEVPISQIRLARDPEFKEEFKPDLLGGMMVIKCKNADGRELTAIPYYAWDHREPGAMAVWVRQEGLPRNRTDSFSGNRFPLYMELRPDMLRPDSELADEVETEVTASHCHPGDSTDAMIDGLEPKDSNDHDIPRMTFWNHKGTQEWIELDFGTPRKVSKSSIYWFDDTGKGECRIPKSWTLSYRDGNFWKPLKTVDTTKKDAYDTVKFETVETTGLRLDIQLQDGFSGGILEWKYE